jgi:hypothetical protein
VAARTIQARLRRYRVPPAPRRAGLAWPAFRRAHAAGRLACDVVTVETVRRQTLSVLFFLAVRTRRVVVANGTAHPTAAGVTHQARPVTRDLAAAGGRATVLPRDRDTTFAPAFAAVCAAAGVRVVRTPVRTPRTDAAGGHARGTLGRHGAPRVPRLATHHW